MTGNPKRATPLDRHIGGRIPALREARRLTQAELAKRLGVATQQVQKYESGANRVSAARLYQIARVLEARIGCFFRSIPSS